MNDKELFENCCLPLFWLEDEERFEKPAVERKNLDTLLAELEEIKNKIDDISAREWHLGKLLSLHNAGLSD